jgi:hypothetical protein
MEFTGTIENGMDLMRLGMILGLFKKKRRSQKTVRNRLFHGSKNTTKIYLETLKLKANEIELFLQF